MVGSLCRVVVCDSVFLQQVNFTLATSELALDGVLASILSHSSIAPIELELSVFSETTRVVVTSGLGITECFKEWTGFQNTVDNRIAK